MIASVSYREAWSKLAPPPVNQDLGGAYRDRELAFLQEKGWFPSAQLLLKTVIGLAELDLIAESEDRFSVAVENSQRVRLVLAFRDGAKPDHCVMVEKGQTDVVFDRAVGIIPIAKLFDDTGPQSYLGTLGFTAYCYRPGRPILTLIKTEQGV
jgi:hypothetical protein